MQASDDLGVFGGQAEDFEWLRGVWAARQTFKSCQEYRQGLARMTAPDGPFPLAEEEVQHYGTTQILACKVLKCREKALGLQRS